jgi:hypothetical protein
MLLQKRFCSCAAIAVFIIASGWFLATPLADEAEEKQAADEDPIGNSKCYVCHLSLQTEEITTLHLEMDITCDECHGPSVEHMHDEMLMTEPDLLFGRQEVNKMCSNRTCHPPAGDRQVYGFQDHRAPEAVEEFFKKWRGRTRPNGRTVTQDSVCTDCHGTHNLDVAETGESEDEPAADWIPLFNGRDLAEWQQSKPDCWKVEARRITATVAPESKSSDLLTAAVYGDYLLAVTFKGNWPLRAGIWLRSTDAEPGPRIEIGAHAEPPAYTGSIAMPGKGLVLANLRKDLVDRGGWNTTSARVEGNRVQVWLNAEEVGVVRMNCPAEGRVGLHIGPGPAGKAGELQVREILLQPLGEPQEDTSEEAETDSTAVP